jgi:hypothetical protein
LRRWEARQVWAGRVLIALSFPLAYLLFMFAGGEAPRAAERVVLGMWAGAMVFGGICAEAAWRIRLRLDSLAAAHPPRPRS